MSKQTKEFAARLLDQLIDLDHTTQAAYYEMGRILASIRDDKLYDMLGYDSMAQLVEEELSFSPATANKYATTYRHFRRLGYNQIDALKLIMDCSWTHVSEALPSAKKKIGARALMNWVDENTLIQVNLAFDKKDHAYLMKILKAYGAVESDSGRLMHSSEALMEALHHVANGKKVA